MEQCANAGSQSRGLATSWHASQKALPEELPCKDCLTAKVGHSLVYILDLCIAPYAHENMCCEAQSALTARMRSEVCFVDVDTYALKWNHSYISQFVYML